MAYCLWLFIAVFVCVPPCFVAGGGRFRCDSKAGAFIGQQRQPSFGMFF